jgi:very-short-patch-repair endonuclease
LFSISVEEPPKTVRAESSSELQLEIDAAPVLSLAMVENAIPLVPRVSLTNSGDAALEELAVEIAVAPNFSAPWTTRISSIPSGGTFNLNDVELPLDHGRLVNQLEKSPAQLTIKVLHAPTQSVLASASKPIDVLAYNEWMRVSVPHLLAAYVQPNHPAVAALLADARAPLERLTRNPALDGYQSKDRGRVAAIAQAIYEAIQRRHITYSNPPASFERSGQKIRTPEQVFTEQVGTCLDLTVLVAAALEQVGLFPLLVLLQGHAFPGVWLEPPYTPDGVIDDRSLVTKLISLGRILVFDSSAVAHQPEVPFADAVQIARAALDDEARFDHVIDVQGARKLGFRPLTMRVGSDYAAVAVPIASPSGPLNIPHAVTAEPSSRKQAKSNRVRNPRVDAWKQKLLDTTLRNRLLNYKETQKALHLLCPDLAAVEDAVSLGEEFAIRARPGIPQGLDPRSKRAVDSRLADGGPEAFLRERLAHRELYVEASHEATSSTLTNIYRGAREALEETGTNTLCLALGMLEWFESDASEQKRRAPVLLLPVALVRSARTSSFTLRGTGDDARLNVTLFEKLRIDTGITLPELEELPLDQAGIDVGKVLNTVRAAVINQRRWEVKDELHLGLFSFAKFQMWADLDQNVEAVLESPVVKHLVFGKGDYPNQGTFVEPGDLDTRVPPSDLLCPLDADASQLAAVVSATEGKTFVLQGPPGTGKSQTITNLIAHAIAQGKRVLFVAEKAAALEVVQRRLTQIGLAPYVLELHSHKAGKVQVLEQLRAALDAQPSADPPDWDRATHMLSATRQQLNDYVTALHRQRGGGFSMFRAFARLSACRDAPVIDLPATCAEPKERFEQVSAEIENLRLAATQLAPVAQSPWQSCRVPAWQVDLPTRVRDAIDRAVARLASADTAGRRLAGALGANQPSTIADLDSLCEIAALLERAPAHGEALTTPAEWTRIERDGTELVELAQRRSTALARLRPRYTDGLLALELAPLATRFRALARAFFLFAWWGLRTAKTTLRQVVREKLGGRAQVADDLELAMAAKDAERKLADTSARGAAIFGASWRGAESDPAALEAALSWGRSLQAAAVAARSGLLPSQLRSSPDLASAASDVRLQIAELRAAIDELADALGWDGRAELARATAPWDALRDRLQRWRADIQRLRHWHAFLVASKSLEAAGCAAIVAAVARGELGVDQLHRSFEKGVYNAWVRRELKGDPILGAFDGERHTRLIESFAQRDHGLLASCGDVARARIARRAPAAAAGAASGGEMATLQRELGKKRRQMSIRKLLAEIPSLAARLKPCFLMSPMSVAQYLDPRSSTKFDIVVFDEASQIPTHDAIGVLARGTSAVVVGDSKQLPPTSFFATGSEETEDEVEIEELESILDECIAAQLPERRLDWHYRSRHESLIAFSNFHYYRNLLNTFPSASERGPGRGVWFREITGAYDKGASRTNKAEATAIVEELLLRLRVPDAARRSYGVVTFSKAQQTLVEDLLDRARQQHPEIEPFFEESQAEPLIVRNLENIQGDERDVMLFSICYGPDQNGKLSMSFGPLNLDGGERRLNVAVTRARQELVVFSTLLPDHIDTTRTKAVGVKHLKTFLDYARRGPVAIAEALDVAGGDDFDSPFEQEVCERLRARGYRVDTQVGCAGYRIDLGVHHPDLPGRYVLAIECDGAYYHSARSARERDRLRAQVLAGLGWTIHRIWSTDWWQDPETEVAKALAAIERAIASSNAPKVAIPEPAPVPARAPKLVESGPVSGRTSAAAAVVAYEIASVPSGRRAPDDVHDDRFKSELSKLLVDVALVEAPVTLRVLARRILPYFGLRRTSARLEARLRTALAGSKQITIRGEVVWRADQDPSTFMVARLAPSEAEREAGEVPVEEVANAAAGVLRANVALEHDELVKLTARALGFARTGEKVADHMGEGVNLLLKRGAAKRDGDKVVLA